MPRVVLIGLDGADPALMTRWMDAGRLPRLAALRDRGALLPCASTVPPVTFPAWTTCVTGVNPGRHGIFDFTEREAGTGRLVFVNGTFRRAPALWEILSAAGRRCCVAGVPGTYPPEAVNGVFVSGFDSPVTTRATRAFVSPASAWDAVKGWPFADFQESRIGPGWHERALAKLHEGIAAKERILLGLLARERWDFFMAVFGESDTASHHFWLFHDPASPRHRPGFADAIGEIYARLDEAVGRLADAAGDDAVVMIVSDHGFGGAGTGVVHLNNWLAERGHLRFAAQGAGDPWIKRAAMRAVPARWQGAAFRAARPLAERAEGTARTAGIDWSETRAWSEELTYFPSVRINLRGRDPEGIVAETDYASLVADLCAELEAWEWVARAQPRDAVYDGPEVHRAPDIILTLAEEDGYAVNCLRARGGPSFRRLAAEEYVGGKERGMSGVHRPTGVWMVPRPTAATDVSLLDVAPTTLGLLGVAGPPMEGRDVLGGGPVDRAPGVALRERTAYGDEDARILEERLRALGYYE